LTIISNTVNTVDMEEKICHEH